MNEITVNWHIIQKCNYKCNYCFAKYDNYDKKEVHNSKKEIEILLNKIYQAFSNKYKDYNIRLNIAGGEPTLSKNLYFIIQTCPTAAIVYFFKTITRSQPSHLRLNPFITTSMSLLLSSFIK